VTAAVEGRLSYRADETRHQEDFARIIQGVNEALGTLVGHLDIMPVAAMVIDTEFNIRYINNTGCGTLFERKKATPVGTKCYDFFKTGDCRTDGCAMRSGSSATSETDAHPNGKTLDISYTGVPLRDAQGTLVGALEVISDLTHVKQAARQAAQAAALARKQGAFQAKEIEKLVVNLNKVAQGDLAVAAADEDTQEVAANFEQINAAVRKTVHALEALIKDADALAEAAAAGRPKRRVTAASTGASWRG
jgi:methyl-accepting chemotaxis protein